jgi:hypothetical protein
MNKGSVGAGALMLALTGATSCWGQASVEEFIQADLNARQATIRAMEQRLMMRAGSYDPTVDADLIAQGEQSVAEVFRLYGTTGSAHAAFAQRHAQEIEAWLEAHPDTVTSYEELQARWQSLADALDSARRQ